MECEINGLIEQWESIRCNSLSFINELSDEMLDKSLPRKGLDTIRKHFVEMCEVEKDYVNAIKSGVMDFNGPSDSDIPGDTSKDELINNMKKEDEKLVSYLSNNSYNKNIIWFGEKKSISYHISALIAHESLHIGQIIAFCYLLNIDIPKDVVESWALSGK